MKKQFLAYSVVALAALSIAGCRGSRKPVSESRAGGIVSLTPSITRQLTLLGIEDEIVGHTSYCPSDGLRNSAEVASAMMVNVERIRILRPSLVLCTPLVKETHRQKLEKLGLPVRCLESPASFEELCEQFVELGRLVGKQDAAEMIVDRQRARVEALRAVLPIGSSPKIFIEIGAKPLWTATSSSFMHDYIRLAGGTNVAADLATGQISREAVLNRNPDIIVIVAMGITGPQERKEWLAYDSLDAAKDGAVFVIDSDRACSPTPVTFVDILEELIGLIYDGRREH